MSAIKNQDNGLMTDALFITVSSECNGPISLVNSILGDIKFLSTWGFWEQSQARPDENIQEEELAFDPSYREII